MTSTHMEPPDRLGGLYGTVARSDGGPAHLARLRVICHSGVEVLSVTGVGAMLMAERVHQCTLYATDDVIGRLEDLQNTVAEGPCIDSYNLGRPVLEPDLAGSGSRAWPSLAAAAREVGIHALFSFPLQLDGASIGAFDLYRDRPGPLSVDEVSDARLLAAMVTREVLAMQSEAEPGSLPEQIADLSGDRAAIEQATGMVAAQLDTDINEAARRLRQAAAELDRPLTEVAVAIVSRELRLS